MIALAGCADGVYLVDVDEEQIAGHEPDGIVERERMPGLAPPWAAKSIVDVDAVGSTVVLLLDRRPPLLVSHDGGVTWSERGGGLPAGRAVAVADNPDLVLFGARNRLYVSRNGGLFWSALTVELPEILDVAWA
jgi:hypothetical protein